jgi:hypothetical protein
MPDYYTYERLAQRETNCGVFQVRREHLIYIVLFGVSYAGFLGYFYRDSKGAVAAGQARVVSKESVERITESGMAVQSTVVQSTTSIPANSVSPASSQSKHSAKGAITEQDSQALAAAPLVIDYTSPQATLRSLEAAVVNDEYSENRVLAVARLRQMAADGDKNGQIREALRTAASDLDPAVADSARAAYAEVSEWTAVRK